MFNNRLALVKELDIPADRRIIVVSDIHGNLEYLRGVLAKAGFGANDELMIDGDFLERGRTASARCGTSCSSAGRGTCM